MNLKEMKIKKIILAKMFYILENNINYILGPYLTT
jgi:hypothetical protein